MTAPLYVRRAVLAAALLAGLTLSARADSVTVFAAASLKDALDEIAAEWRADTGHSATLSYGGSSALARQIEQGAPADLFISASVEWMDTLAEGNHIAADTRRDLLGNTLVLIAAGREAASVAIEPGFDLSGLLGDGRLAMALVDSVPAGVYGKQALTALGVWEAVEPKVAQADNVRAALSLVAAGEAPYGIVYRTDANAQDAVTVVGTFPADSHDPIVYPVAVTAESTSPVARAFLEHLSAAEAAATFETWGFDVVE